MFIVPAEVRECLLKERKCSSKMVANAVCRRTFQSFSNCVAMVLCSPPIFSNGKVSLKRMAERKTSDEGMQVAISEVLSERARLPLLSHAEHYCQNNDLLKAHNVRRRLILSLLPLPHPRSMQLMLKAAILATLHPSSVSPKQKATKSQKSKKNAAQPGLEPEKWSKNWPQKGGG